MTSETCPARALTINPDHTEALKNRGSVLRLLNRPAEAIASYDRVLLLNPNDSGALYNRGNALRDLDCPNEALANYDKALALKPNDVDILINRGTALHELRRPSEAIASFDRALEIRPDSPKPRWNRSCCRLVLGDLERGFEEYEWRWKLSEHSRFRRSLTQPLWDGRQSIEGKTILLRAEQGFGDTIQFCRYVPLVRTRGAQVILEVQSALKSLISSIEGASLVLASGEKVPPFDYHCPLLSLPRSFKTTLATIPATNPYLFPSKHRLTKWKKRLPKSGALRIGVAWAGRQFREDRTRSIGLSRLSTVLSATGIEFISIQKELRLHDRDLLRTNPPCGAPRRRDRRFRDTAAIISLLDLVVSSDTSVVHLAGALGKPVWVLLQYAAEWRWLLDRTDSPRYPTARLFRQSRLGDWEGVIRQLEHELAVLRSGNPFRAASVTP